MSVLDDIQVKNIFRFKIYHFFPKIILKKIWVNAFLNQLNPMYLTIYTYSAFGA